MPMRNRDKEGAVVKVLQDYALECGRISDLFRNHLVNTLQLEQTVRAAETVATDKLYHLFRRGHT